MGQFRNFARLAQALAVAGMAALQIEAQAPTMSIDLTRGSAWEYRLVTDGHEGPWTADLKALAAGIALPKSLITWPKSWVTFGAWDDGTGPKAPNDDPAALAQVPTTMTLNGVSACRATLGSDERGTLDVSWGQGEPAVGRWAYAFAKLEMADAQEIVVAAAADGPMTWWVDGKPAFDSAKAGVPGAHVGGLPGFTFPLTLAKGTHVLAVRVESGASEWRLTTAAAPAPWPPNRALQARCAFDVADPAVFASLTFAGPDIDHTTLNGQPLPMPLPRHHYSAVPGITAAWLRAGRNGLLKSWPAEDVDRLLTAKDTRNEGTLTGIPPAAAEVITGAIVVKASETALTVMCRTNALVPCVLTLDGRTWRSEPGLFHRFVVAGLKPATEYPYTVAPDVPGATAKSATVKTFPTAGPLTIAVSGDPQGAVATFVKVVRQIADEKPDLTVLCGDLVGDGLVESYWESQFFGPVWRVAAQSPIYAVRGNHDRRAPMFDRFLAEPQGGRDWAQEIAGVLLVGLDGQYDWRPGSPCYRWLEATLAASKARFVFVFNHYPAYSSTTHGRLNEDGRINDPAGRAAREFLYPLLQKYRVTAYITGHDHGYERSMPPGGVPSITAAGAGAVPYGQSADAKQNPYSVLRVGANHHCLLKIDGDICTFTAIAVDGRTLDQLTWDRRLPAGSWQTRRPAGD
jgi:hypothetical protein